MRLLKVNGKTVGIGNTEVVTSPGSEVVTGTGTANTQRVPKSASQYKSKVKRMCERAGGPSGRVQHMHYSPMQTTVTCRVCHSSGGCVEWKSVWMIFRNLELPSRAIWEEFSNLPAICLQSGNLPAICLQTYLPSLQSGNLAAIWLSYSNKRPMAGAVEDSCAFYISAVNNEVWWQPPKSRSPGYKLTGNHAGP